MPRSTQISVYMTITAVQRHWRGSKHSEILTTQFCSITWSDTGYLGARKLPTRALADFVDKCDHGCTGTRRWCLEEDRDLREFSLPLLLWKILTIGMKDLVGKTIDRFRNYCLGARRGKYLVAKDCYGPWHILLNVNPPRFPVCYLV